MNSIAPSIAHQMTQIYVFVDNYLKEHPQQAAWRRSNNDAPAFSDAEVITVGLLQGAFGCATLKKTYQQENLSTGCRQLAQCFPAFMQLRSVDGASARSFGSGRTTPASRDRSVRSFGTALYD